MSHREVEQLLEELSTSTAADRLPDGLDRLESQLRAGRKVDIKSIEPILKRLSDAGLGRRAAELMNVLRHAGVDSRKAYFLSIEAAHRAGAHLLVAPLVHALGQQYQERHSSVKKLIRAMKMEYDPITDAAPKREAYRRYTKASKLVLCNHDRTKIWCHYRDADKKQLDFPGGKEEPGDSGPLATLRRELLEECGVLSPLIEAAVEDTLKLYPEGHARARVRTGPEWGKLCVVHVWVVALPSKEEVSLATQEPHKHRDPQWRTVEEVLTNLSKGRQPDRRPYRHAVEKGLRRKAEFSADELRCRYLRDPSPAVEYSPEAEDVRRELDRAR